MLAEHALANHAGQRGLEALRLRGIVFGIIGRPAHRHDWMTIAAAGMDCYRQTMALGGGVDWPIVALAQRHLAVHQHEHLHEALVRSAALDFIHREFGVLHRHHDGGA